MFASGVNKNTKKFAPKIPQRRGAGGSTAHTTPTPAPSPAPAVQIDVPTSSVQLTPPPLNAAPQQVSASPQRARTSSVTPGPSASPIAARRSIEPSSTPEEPNAMLATPPTIAVTQSSAQGTPIVLPSARQASPTARGAPIVQPPTQSLPNETPVEPIPQSPTTSPAILKSPPRVIPSVHSSIPKVIPAQQSLEDARISEPETQGTATAVESEIEEEEDNDNEETEDTAPAGEAEGESSTEQPTTASSTKGNNKVKAKTPAKPRAPRKRKTPSTSTDVTNAGESSLSTTTPAAKKRRTLRKPRQPAVVDLEADANGESASQSKRRRRQREITPPNAEEIQIVPGIVKMSDLCRDTKTGKKSKRYEELEKIDWSEVVRKQRAKKARIEAAKAAGEAVPPTESIEERLERLAQENSATRPAGPRHAMQVRVVNGQIVLDEETLQIDRRELVQDEGPREIVEESALTRRVNAGTWSKREKPERWDAESTEKFYEGLSMFGTDFELISRLFPDRSRRQIKNKFNAEERKAPERVTNALKNRVVVDIDEYSKIANTEFGDARELDRELEEMRAAHAEEERKAIEAAKELDRERRDMQDAAAAATAAAGAEGNAIGVVSNAPRRRGKGKGQFISRHQGGGEEILLGTI